MKKIYDAWKIDQEFQRQMKDLPLPKTEERKVSHLKAVPPITSGSPEKTIWQKISKEMNTSILPNDNIATPRNILIAFSIGYLSRYLDRK